MKKNNNNNITTEEVYNNDLFNGRVPREQLPYVQQKVTYPHPNKTGEMTSQNYVEYDDLAVVVFIRKNEKGEFEFGLIEQEAPAFIYKEDDENTIKGYKGIFLEAPSFALPEKNRLPEDMANWLEEKILEMGLEMQGFASLDDSKTALCQSFTNLNARFYVAGIKEGEQDVDNKMHWFPMSSLENYLDMQRRGGKENLHSTIQTLYPLEQLRNKYKTQIQRMKPTEFKLDRELPELKSIKKIQTNPGYRFSVWEAYYINTNEPKTTKVVPYLTSRSNSANCVLMTEDGEKMYLSPQKRSPYMTVGEELKMEVAGGLNNGKTYKQTAIAELSEEQGFYANSVEEFTGLLALTPLTSEVSQAFIAYYEQGEEGNQNLDEQESIGKKQAKSFKSLFENIRNSDNPLTTKYYIMLKARDKEKEINKEQEER